MSKKEENPKGYPMDAYEAWELALKETEIIRPRVKNLMTYASTQVPYILLSKSEVSASDTVVRKGEVLVRKPSLILPPNVPQFKGFDFGDQPDLDENSIMSFLLVRGIQMPSMKYNNRTHSLDIFEGKIDRAIKHYANGLERQENVHAGLLAGPQECWQFSVLIYVTSQIVRNAEYDIQQLLKDYHRKKRP